MDYFKTIFYQKKERLIIIILSTKKKINYEQKTLFTFITCLIGSSFRM